MRVLLQRVSSGKVLIHNEVVGAIGLGVVLLVGVGHEDTPADADSMADKIAMLRIFNNEQGRMDLSLLDVDGGALVVSQFTLYAETRRGRRPSFVAAARPEHAQPLIDRFAERLRTLGVNHVATGVFGATMDVQIHNQGPVTLWLDQADPQKAG